jgi:hypothetical protein
MEVVPAGRKLELEEELFSPGQLLMQFGLQSDQAPR